MVGMADPFVSLTMEAEILSCFRDTSKRAINIFKGHSSDAHGSHALGGIKCL